MIERSTEPRLAEPAMDVSLADVKSTLRRLIEENAGIPADSIADDSSIEGDLAMDSFSFVSLQVAVEETFGVACAPEEIEARNDFDGIARLILERATGAAPRRAAVAPIPLDEHRRSTARRS